MVENGLNSSTCTEIAFSSDGLLLKGFLHLPARKQPPVVIGSHGLLSSGASPKQVALAQQAGDRQFDRLALADDHFLYISNHSFGKVLNISHELLQSYALPEHICPAQDFNRNTLSTIQRML